jgi:hypothetical protein
MPFLPGASISMMEIPYLPQPSFGDDPDLRSVRWSTSADPEVGEGWDLSPTPPSPGLPPFGQRQ